MFNIQTQPVNQGPDPAKSILDGFNGDTQIKAAAWEAFRNAADERDLEGKLQGVNLPDSVKADLWESKRASPQNAQEHAIRSVGGDKGLQLYRAAKGVVTKAESMIKANHDGFEAARQDFIAEIAKHDTKGSH